MASGPVPGTGAEFLEAVHCFSCLDTLVDDRYVPQKHPAHCGHQCCPTCISMINKCVAIMERPNHDPEQRLVIEGLVSNPDIVTECLFCSNDSH